MRRALPYILFLALVVVFLWKPIFAGQALLPGDYLAQMSPWKSVVKASDPLPQWNPLQWDAIAQFYPWRVFYAKWMGQGIIPFWNPHQFCGTPFLANGQSAVLYPLNLVFLTFDPITAFTAYAALHLFLAAAFTYLLLRELGCKELGGIVGGITFAFCAFMVRWLELPTFVGAAVWLPLSLLLIHRSVERRSVSYAMLSGLVIALAFLAGHLQIAFYVLFASVLWWLWKLGQVSREEGKPSSLLKVIVPGVACLLIFGLIASAQLLPSIELSRNSHRAGGPTAEGYEWFIGNSLKAYHLITAFIPDFYGSPARNDFILLGRIGETRHVASAADYMEYGLYAGVLPLMLAAVGVGLLRRRNVGFFALLAGLSLLIALGTPTNWPFYHLVPGFSSLGGPNRILMLYFLGVAGLASVGADWVAAHASDAVQWRGRTCRAISRALVAVAVLVLAAVACDLIARGFLWSFGRSEPQGPFMLTAGRLVVFLVAGVLLMALRGGDRISRSMFGLLAVGLICADLLAAGIDYNPTCDRGKVYPDTPLTRRLQSLAKNERIAPINPEWSLFQTPDAILPPNTAMVYGLYDVQGYDSLFTRQYKDLSSEVQGQDSSPVENGNMVLVRRYAHEGLAGTLGVGYLITRADLSQFSSVIAREIASSAGIRVYEQWERDYDSGRRMGPRDLARFVPRYSTPNSLVAPLGGGPPYPGWEMDYLGRRIPRWREVGLAPRPDKPNASFVFEPFSFRLGLFLMLTGVGALSCAGTRALLRRRVHKP